MTKSPRRVHDPIGRRGALMFGGTVIYDNPIQPGNKLVTNVESGGRSSSPGVVNPTFRRECLFDIARAIRNAFELRMEVVSPEDDAPGDCKPIAVWQGEDVRIFSQLRLPANATPVAISGSVSRDECQSRFGEKMDSFVHMGPQSPESAVWTLVIYPVALKDCFQSRVARAKR